MSEFRKKIFGQAGIYSLSTFAAQLITVAASLLSRRFLGPVQTGIWTAFQIVVNFSGYSSFGVLNAALREIPYQIGKGNVKEADRIKNVSASFVLGTAIPIAVGLFLFAFFTQGHFRKEISFGLMLVAALIILQRFNNLLVTLLRCYQRFDVESHLMIISAFVNALLVGVLAFYFQIYGFVWAMILSFLFNILFVCSKYSFNFHWIWDRLELKKLIQLGLPLMLLGVGVTLHRSLDEIMILKFLGFKSLGWYSSALMVTSYLSNYPISLQLVFIPNFQEKYGKAGSFREMQSYLNKSCLATSLTMAIFIASAWTFAPYAIRLVLPKFVPGIEPMMLLCFNVFFLAAGQVFYDSLINIKKHFWGVPIILTSIIVTGTLQFLAIKCFHSIMAVAAATTLGAVVYFFLSFLIAARFFYDGREAANFLAKLFAIVIYLTVYYFLMRWNFQAGFYIRLAIEFGCWILFCAPIAYFLNRHFGIWNMLRAKFQKKRQASS